MVAITRNAFVVIEVTLENLERAIPFSIDAHTRGNSIRTFIHKEGFKPLTATLVMEINTRRLLNEEKLKPALKPSELRHVLEFRDELLSGTPIRTATSAYRAFMLALEARLGQYDKKEGWQIKHPIIFHSKTTGKARLARLKMQRKMFLAASAPLEMRTEYD